MKNFQAHLPQGDPEVMYRDDLDIVWTARYLTYSSYLQEFDPNYKLAIL